MRKEISDYLTRDLGENKAKMRSPKDKCGRWLFFGDPVAYEQECDNGAHIVLYGVVLEVIDCNKVVVSPDSTAKEFGAPESLEVNPDDLIRLPGERDLKLQSLFDECFNDYNNSVLSEHTDLSINGVRTLDKLVKMLYPWSKA